MAARSRRRSAPLTQLLSFHLDKIKIDRSFVSRLDKNDDGLIIVRAILGLAKGFGLTTAAEGVEDIAQLAYLRPMAAPKGRATCSARPFRRRTFRPCSRARC